MNGMKLIKEEFIANLNCLGKLCCCTLKSCLTIHNFNPVSLTS